MVRVLLPQDHALLFALLAREALTYCGEEQGAELLRKGVGHYGTQRGRRMAARARADGRALDVAAYLAYSEWRAEPGASRGETLATSPDLHQVVYSCPWNQTWRQRGLLPYGRHYCLHIDRAVLHGFNPLLRLDVPGTLSNSAPRCDFIFRQAQLTVDAEAAAYADREALTSRAALPWSYHCAHLLKAIGQTLVNALGPAGEQMVANAMAEMVTLTGPEVVGAISAELHQDFDRLPRRQASC